MTQVTNELEEVFNPRVVEHCMAFKRAEINHYLEEYLGKKYDTEDHNIALAFLHFKDGSDNVLAAYSNDSALTQRGYSGESLLINLGLVPNLYPELPTLERYGCDGRGQYHTEPKLLNYLTASIEKRQSPYITGPGFLRNVPILKKIIEGNRQSARSIAGNLKHPSDLTHLLIATEIDCCPTCEKYSIKRFREIFPKVIFDVKSFHKIKGSLTQYEFTEVTKSKPSRVGKSAALPT